MKTKIELFIVLLFSSLLLVACSSEIAQEDKDVQTAKTEQHVEEEAHEPKDEEEEFILEESQQIWGFLGMMMKSF